MNKIFALIITSLLLFSLILEVQPFVKANPVTPKPWDAYILVFSPLNTTYNTNSILLNVSLGTVTASKCPGETGQVNYSLDGLEYVYLPVYYKGIISDNSMPHSSYEGTINLHSLPDGEHIIRLFGEISYIKESITLTTNNTVKFTVNTHILPTSTYSNNPTPTVPEFPTQILLTLFILTLIAMISIIVKKHLTFPRQ